MSSRRSSRPYLIAAVVAVLAVVGWFVSIRLSVFPGDWTRRGIVTGVGLMVVVALIVFLRALERRDGRRSDQDRVERRKRWARARDGDAAP